MKGNVVAGLSPRVDPVPGPGRSTLGSASRSLRNPPGARTPVDRSVAQPPRHAAVRVFDEDGNDVTPQPLHPVRHVAKAVGQRHKVSSFLDEISVVSASERSGDSVCSMPFSRSMTMSHTSTEEPTSPTEQHISKQHIQDAEQRAETVIQDVTEDMLKEDIFVHITETELITVLDLPSTSVSAESDDAPGVRENNSRYAEVCSTCSGTDKYVNVSVQKMKGPAKNKQAQTDPVTFVDSALDPYNALSTEQSESESNVIPHWVTYKKAEVEASKAEDASLSSSRSASSVSVISSRTSGDEIGFSLTPELELQMLMSSESFHNCLQLMERVILANILQPQLASYRLLHNIKDGDVNVGKVEQLQGEVVEVTEDWKGPQPPAVELLWVFSCRLTRGHSVTTMAWNKKNPDVLAVGYSNFDYGYHKPGLVCCWSIKNTKWPNRVIHCDGPVTSLNFSYNNPSQLAVGMLDGTIVIYNIYDQHIKSCVYSTNDSPSRHMGPVWQLKWCHLSPDLSTKSVDSLFSVAADGRISKWNQGSNGLDCHDLMKLARVLHIQKKATAEERTEDSVLTSLIPGLSFDFHSVNSNIYLIGTWDGLIHKCTRSNTQHSLETYRSHLCAVNAVVWSPFSPDVFLSCSSDCTIQLWKQYHLRPLLTFTCLTGAVEDIKWSQRQAAVFGAVSEKQLLIWDLSLNMREPVIVQPTTPTANMKKLLFSTETNCVLVGDSDGLVSVYQLKNLHEESSQVDVLDGVISSVLSS